MFKNIGTTELIIIFVIIFFLFGGNKLKEFARGLGESTKELKKVKKEYDDALNEQTWTDPKDKKSK